MPQTIFQIWEGFGFFIIIILSFKILAGGGIFFSLPFCDQGFCILPQDCCVPAPLTQGFVSAVFEWCGCLQGVEVKVGRWHFRDVQDFQSPATV